MITSLNGQRRRAQPGTDPRREFQLIFRMLGVDIWATKSGHWTRCQLDLQSTLYHYCCKIIISDCISTPNQNATGWNKLFHLDFWKPWDMPDECMCSPCDCDPFQAGLIRTPHKFKPHEFEQALEPLRMVHFYLCKCFLVKKTYFCIIFNVPVDFQLSWSWMSAFCSPPWYFC